MGGERRAPALNRPLNLLGGRWWCFALPSCLERPPDVLSLQRLAGDHLLLQLQHFDRAGHVGPHPHVHCSGISVLHRLHQGGAFPHLAAVLCRFGRPNLSSSPSVCRSTIFTAAAEPACPKLRRNGQQEPGRTLTSRPQLSRRPWVQPQEACRISSPVHNTTTTRCSLLNKEMMRKICQSLGKIPRKSPHKTANAAETTLMTHIWVSRLAKSLLC